MQLLGQYAIEHRTRFLVVDVREFQGQPSAETVGSWRDEHVLPLYNEAGTEKFAFLVAAPAEPDSPAHFPTRHLPSWEAVRAWFAQAD